MEDMIKKIIEIDRKAFEKRQNTERIIQKYEERLEEIYDDLGKEIVQDAKSQAKMQYEQEIGEYQKVIVEIEKDCDTKIQLLDQKFEQIHDFIKKELFTQIFESVLGDV
jgi:F0F1-type ATP synthase membrane subunit b/b'